MTVSFDLWLLLPVLAPVAGLVLVLLLDALLPREGWIARPVGLLALLAGAGATVPVLLRTATEPALTLCPPASDAATCLYAASSTTATLQLGILLACAAVLLLGGDRSAPPGVDPATVGLRGGPAIEVVLVLAVAAGGAGVVAARDVGSWLVLIELATLPAVALVALHVHRRTPGAALTLLTTSLVSFALLVLGVALWVTATGSPVFSPSVVEAAATDPLRRPVLLLAAVALLSGLGFKLSLVPFHAWTPTTFSGASLPVATLLATASKLAATGALLVVLLPFAPLFGTAAVPHVLVAGLAATALLSMLLGTVIALRANDVVRLLAFSTIAQAGWVVLPLAALSDAGRRAAAGYALTYVVASLVAFAAVQAAQPSGIQGRPLTAFAGLLRTRPLIGGPLALALFVLAGLPPGIIGLVAKIEALAPVIAAGFWPLAVLAVIAVVLGLAVYVRWFAVLLRAAPDEGEGEDLDDTARRIGRGSLTVLVVGTVVLVATSVIPQLLWGLLR